MENLRRIPQARNRISSFRANKQIETVGVIQGVFFSVSKGSHGVQPQNETK